ncbi:DUF6265 family protein [Phaeocystidibacter luteus]|uniref:DUF6265 domain-containing protein n=1 Tax=Phaeocystidibacter luteus TaxID=911197 RepID=A0A6N6RG73_9FLAO|nr:DUF6265 family protein [Phaeocystidibacter luteus]KAB2810171.1 hypothetical protein F8C67_08025 [Phaeocystidibacter luteus]
MKTYLLPILAITLTACSSNSNKSLDGCWLRDDDKTMECWTSIGDSLIGKGMAIRGHGDTLVFEELLIINENGSRVYIADVAENEEPVRFTETSDFVFENPEHDFPKRIEYVFLSSDQIEVHVGGDEEEFVWRYTRK